MMAKLTGDAAAAGPLAGPGDFAAAVRNRFMHWRGRQGTKALAVRVSDDRLTVEDMVLTIERVEALCQDRGKLREPLSKHLSGDELRDAMRVLPERAKVLWDVMRECFGPVDDPVFVPTMTPLGAAQELSRAWSLPRAA